MSDPNKKASRLRYILENLPWLCFMFIALVLMFVIVIMVIDHDFAIERHEKCLSWQGIGEMFEKGDEFQRRSLGLINNRFKVHSQAIEVLRMEIKSLRKEIESLKKKQK